MMKGMSPTTPLEYSIYMRDGKYDAIIFSYLKKHRPLTLQWLVRHIYYEALLLLRYVTTYEKPEEPYAPDPVLLYVSLPQLVQEAHEQYSAGIRCYDYGVFDCMERYIRSYKSYETEDARNISRFAIHESVRLYIASELLMIIGGPGLYKFRRDSLEAIADWPISLIRENHTSDTPIIAKQEIEKMFSYKKGHSNASETDF